MICIYLVKNHFPTAPAIIMCWQPVQNCMNQKRPSRLYHCVTCNKFWNNIFWTITLPRYINRLCPIPGKNLEHWTYLCASCINNPLHIDATDQKNSLAGIFYEGRTPLLPDYCSLSHSSLNIVLCLLYLRAPTEKCFPIVNKLTCLPCPV